jgi:hypothetical protein
MSASKAIDELRMPVSEPKAKEDAQRTAKKQLPEETDELRAKRDIAYAGAFRSGSIPYYVFTEKQVVSEWSTKGLGAAHYGYNVYDDF